MTVIFDFDGTLCDTFPIIKEAIQEIRIEQGMAPLEDCQFDIVRGKIGLSTKHYMELFVSPDDIDQHVESYKRKSLEKLPAFFPGIKQMLLSLHSRGIRLIVATNKLQEIISPLLAKMKCDDLFDEIRGVDYVKYFPKPDPSELQCEGKRVFVGDTRTDQLTAVNAGCDFIGVSYGMEPGHTLKSGSFAVVDTSEQLEEAILRWLGQ